jgi:hypothetical protein
MWMSGWQDGATMERANGVGGRFNRNRTKGENNGGEWRVSDNNQQNPYKIWHTFSTT